MNVLREITGIYLTGKGNKLASRIICGGEARVKPHGGVTGSGNAAGTAVPCSFFRFMQNGVDGRESRAIGIQNRDQSITA